MTILKNDGITAATYRKLKRLAGRSMYLPTEAPHFQVQVDGNWYVFCMLPKNASSSIRAIIHAARKHEGKEKVDSLMAYHLVNTPKQIDQAKHVMVFLRHPLDRVVSAFQNKFIHRSIGPNERSILFDYESVTGRPYKEASFELFVSRYLCACFSGIQVEGRRNHHIFTQTQQMLPIDYDVVAKVNEFDEVMEAVGLGHLMSGRANATSGKVDMPEAWRMTAGELHEHYRETGQTPNKESLLNDELIREINYLYRADLQAFGHLFDKEAG